MYQIAANEHEDVRGLAGQSAARPATLRVRRAFWGAATLCALAVLAIARNLTPDPRGFGTHTQLGLPPCALLELAHVPCPLCGLTTSFAHMAHLSVGAAFMSHPLGPALFVLTTLSVPAFGVACLRETPIVRTIDRFAVRGSSLALLGIIACIWLVRLWM